MVEGIHEEYPGRKEKIVNRILSNPDKVLKSVFPTGCCAGGQVKERFVLTTHISKLKGLRPSARCHAKNSISFFLVSWAII